MVWIMNGDSEQRSEREGDGTMKKNGVLKLKKKRDDTDKVKEMVYFDFHI